MNIKIKRIESFLQKEVTDIILNEIKFKNTKMITITDFKLSNDLGYARIYFTTFLDEKRDEILQELNKNKGFIKKQLCKRRLKIKKIPELEFIYDKLFDYANNVENIIKKLHDS
jgi:ribosome-binding factor A